MTEENFEAHIEKSKAILEKLMNPDITLGDSVTLYKEGIGELQKASKMLENAKLELKTYQEDQNSSSQEPTI